MTREGAAVAVVLLLLAPVVARAHERHRHGSMPAVADSGRDSVGVKAPMEPASERYALPTVAEGVPNHLHNKIVHFPIVLSVVSLVGFWLGRRDPGLHRFARVCAWAAAFLAGAAWVAGLSQMASFDGDPKAWLVPVHRNWGIATTTALILAAVIGQWSRTRRRAWVAAFLAVLMVGVTGYLGGLLSHG